MLFLHFIYLLLLGLGVAAKTHVFHYNATYVDANPDGTFQRRMIGINNEWPVPTIRVRKNDRVQIHFTNGLGDRNTSLHFHGLFMKGNNAMDGPEMVTQCPIPPGFTFTYDFIVADQAGTYWYHSHSGSQYADGLRGLFIIEDDLPFEFDEEVILSMADYYHLESPEIMKKFKSRYNPTGAEPIPQNSLLNDTKNLTWSVQQDTTYLVRLVNMGLFASQYLYIEDHKFTIVEIDGILVKPVEVDSLYIAVAQRYSILVHTKKANKNFRLVNIIDETMLDVLPQDLQVISTNWVQYNKNGELPAPLENGAGSFEKLVESLNPYDDFKLQPLDKVALLEEPDYQISLDFTMDNLGDGVNYAFFNNITYTPPKVPTLMTVLSSGEHASEAVIYGSNTNTFVLGHNEVVEIVINNMDPGKHPFHLHGHAFQVIYRSPEGDDEENPIVYDPSNPKHHEFPEYPMIRDTIEVNANGFIIIRFKSDNPGVWFFHCHVDWHLEQGLAITLVEAPKEILKQNISQNHFDACIQGKVPFEGNAAANNVEWFDLNGENRQFVPLPEGFTTKGYFALLVCTIVAVYGVFTIYKYGIEDVNSESNEATMTKLYQILHKYNALDSEQEEAFLRSENASQI
jgi:iron transport multicopper oxidase